MPDKRSAIEEAVDSIKQLKTHAVANARQVLAESMSSEVKKAVDAAINEELGGGGDPPANYDEDGEQQRVDGEGEDMSDEGDGPAIIEAGLDEEEEEDFDIDDEELEDECNMYEADDEEELDFDIEDDDEDMEMEGDDMDMDDDEEVDIDIEDDEEMEDEGALKMEIKKLKRSLRESEARVKRAEKAIRLMKETVEEVNLFNARLMGVQKLQSRFSLTEAKRDKIVERFDDCESISEVKRTYKTLVEALRETRRTKKPVKRNVNMQTSKSNMNESKGSGFERMQQLANLL